MSRTDFAADWLNERFACDNAARNRAVEQLLLQSVADKTKLRIVDIGSGTGSNLCYFADRLHCDQDWVLIEQDPVLCHGTMDRINAIYGTDFAVCPPGGKAVFSLANDQKVTVTLICDSFFNLPAQVDLHHIDVVMAAAIFDVLSRTQFERLLDNLWDTSASLLSTMNYHNMRFLPEDSDDDRYIRLYEEHMVRQQHFGVAMGKNCLRDIATCFKERNRPLIKGDSIWNLGPEAVRMHRYLLGYMAKSIPEMLREPHEPELLRNWLNNKRRLSDLGQLTIEVAHFDFLHLWGEYCESSCAAST